MVMRFIFALSFIIVYTVCGSAQDSKRTEVQVITLSEITKEVTKVNQTLIEKQALLVSDDRKSVITRETDTLIFRLNLLREDPRIHNIDELNFRSLANIESEWNLLSDMLLSLQSELSDRVQELENERDLLNSHALIWENTLKSASASNAPESVTRQVENTISSLINLESGFGNDSDFIQDKLVKISKGLIFCNEIIGQISQAQDQVTRQLFDLNRPPLWRAIAGDERGSLLKSQRSLIDDLNAEIKNFAVSQTFRIFMHIILFVVVLLVL